MQQVRKQGKSLCLYGFRNAKSRKGLAAEMLQRHRTAVVCILHFLHIEQAVTWASWCDLHRVVYLVCSKKGC